MAHSTWESKRNRAIRWRIWQEDPRCSYCGRDTVWPDPEDPTRHTRPDRATLDHVYDRLDPKRHEGDNEDKVVLACHKCNAARSSNMSGHQLHSWENEGGALRVYSQDKVCVSHSRP